MLYWAIAGQIGLLIAALLFSMLSIPLSLFWTASIMLWRRYCATPQRG
jgi:hypothetical protein